MASTLGVKKNSVVVVGGGPAGMTAAWFGARAGADVVLLERNEKLGKKLYITGKGRCNLTNTADFEALLERIPHNPRFLQSALRQFSPADLMDWMSSLGVPCQVQRGGRVFPQSEKASDVTRGLEHALREAGVAIRLGARVQSLVVEADKLQGLRLKDGTVIPCEACVLATGGVSYPSTGSTGDGYALLEAAGHTIYPPRPALVPLEVAEAWPKALTGLSLKNVRLTAALGKKKLYDRQGEMLFTHFGISGPLVLELSSRIVDAPLHELRVSLDMKPALTLEMLDARLQREIAEAPKKQFSTILMKILPSRMAELAPGLLKLESALPAGQVDRAQRQRTAAWLKAIPLTITGTRGFAEAVITRGGVEVKEVLPGTMASRKVEGLYIAGELLDVDAFTGGFNLQIAFSTGCLAGRSAGAFVQAAQGTADHP